MDDLTFYREIIVDAQHYNFPDLLTVQNDTLRGWIVTPLSGGELVELQEADKPELWSVGEKDIPIKTEGKVVGNKLHLPIDPAMLVAGKVLQQVVLKRGDGVIRFPAFRLLVDSAVDDYGADTEAGKGIWQELMDKLEGAVAQLDTYKAEAQLAASQARECQTKACQCATKAKESSDLTEQHASEAAESASQAASSASAAKGSQDAAAASADAAKSSADEARSHKEEAVSSATKAKASEETAAESAGKAKASADAAAESRSAAETKATEAAQSASNAETSATKAQNSMEAARNSAADAETEASKATEAAGTAATEAGKAVSAAESASTSATSASTSASEAASSKAAAAASETTVKEIAGTLQGTVDRANTAAERAEQAAQTVQPDATKDSKGIVSIGDGIDVADGKISVDLEPYAKTAEVDTKLAEKADKAHSHSTGDIEGLDWALDAAGKVKSVNGEIGEVKINAVPDGGTAGQVLKKTDTGYAWGEDKDTQPDLTPYAKTTDVDNKLAQKSDDGHGHAISSILGLAAALRDLTDRNKRKVDKVDGKGLSTNDYDATAKAKVDSIGSPSEAPDIDDASSVWSGLQWFYEEMSRRLGGLSFATVTQAQYDEKSKNGQTDAKTIYFATKN